jgi:hypothetical protein
MVYAWCSQERLRFCLPQLAYYFANGPWRMCWIVYGYDPRISADARIYQVRCMLTRGTVAELSRSMVAELSRSMAAERTLFEWVRVWQVLDLRLPAQLESLVPKKSEKIRVRNARVAWVRMLPIGPSASAHAGCRIPPRSRSFGCSGGSDDAECGMRGVMLVRHARRGISWVDICSP